MMWTVQRMDRAFVPGGWRLVTTGWIDHSGRQLGPTPFVTTKTAGSVRGGKNAVNTQIVVTSADSL